MVSKREHVKASFVLKFSWYQISAASDNRDYVIDANAEVRAAKLSNKLRPIVRGGLNVI